jgi:hypothetical protein
LSLMAKPAPVMASATSPTGISADIVIGTGANSLKITKVEFVLAETQLSDAGTCSIPPANDDNCDEMELDPLLVDLPLDATPPLKVLDALVPPGTYTRLQTALHAVTSGGEGEEGAAAFLAAHPDWAGVSVRVVGVYTDANSVPHDFTFISSVNAEIEIAFASAVTVGDNTQNLTITVDVASWFKDVAGAVIDPTNSANTAAINANIQRSFGAFEDNDQDGVDDEQEGEH